MRGECNTRVVQLLGYEHRLLLVKVKLLAAANVLQQTFFGPTSLAFEKT